MALSYPTLSYPTILSPTLSYLDLLYVTLSFLLPFAHIVWYALIHVPTEIAAKEAELQYDDDGDKILRRKTLKSPAGSVRGDLSSLQEEKKVPEPEFIYPEGGWSTSPLILGSTLTWCVSFWGG